MSKAIAPVMITLSLFIVLGSKGQAQTVRPKFLSQAIVGQTNTTVSVKANDPRPLDQAITGMNQHEGWLVDYEDPPWGAGDLVDDTDLAWRAAHPAAKGVTRVGGGPFVSNFSLGGDMSIGSADEEQILDKVIADYHSSGNPGRFELKRENAERFAVVGIGPGGDMPVFDTLITIPVQERTVVDTIVLISRAISQKSGEKIELGTAPTNLVMQTRCRVGGEARPAREILSEVADATRYPLVWKLLYDGDTSTYFLNFSVVWLDSGNRSLPFRPGSMP
jgi:hypothetical protein